MYSNEIYEKIEDYYKQPLYIKKILFLPKNCMYYLACMTDVGKIIWVVANKVKASRNKQSLITQAHNSRISITAQDLQI